MPETASTTHEHETANTVAMLTSIARALVDAPEEVVVDVLPEDDSVLLRLRIAPSDIGKVIGRQGRTARSLRTILSAVGTKSGQRYVLDIVEGI